MIEIRGVSKRYGDKTVLDDVTFTVPDGAVTGLVGPNGAGKTSLLKVVTAVAGTDSGDVRVDGRAYSSAESPAAVLGAMLSAEWIPGHLTGPGYLRYLCDLDGLPKQRVGEALEQVGLAGVGRKRIRFYSLGMRQRLGIAGAMLSRPQNLVLDEPVNGLDPDGIVWLRTLVTEAARAGRAVLLSSHLMTELAMVADAVAVIVEGRVIEHGPLDTFISGQERVVYVESDDLEGVMRELTRAGVRHEPFRGGLVVKGADPAEVGRVAFRAPPGLTHLSVLTRSLEETYFDTVARSSDAVAEAAR